MSANLINLAGGRYLFNDDTAALQQALLNVYNSYSGYGNLVVSGCEVTVNSSGGYNISPGVCYFEYSGQGYLVDYAGATGVSLSGSVPVGGVSSSVGTDTCMMLVVTLESPRPYVNVAAQPGLNFMSISLTTAAAAGSNPIIRIRPAGAAIRWDGIPTGAIGEVRTCKDITVISGNGKGTGIWRKWALANGLNGTDDWTGMFIMGTNSYAQVGATGGSATVTLTAAQSGLPVHTHEINDDGHRHSVPFTNVVNSTEALASGGAALNKTGSEVTRDSTLETTGISVRNSVGQDAAEPHSILPPFVKLFYMQKIA